MEMVSVAEGVSYPSQDIYFRMTLFKIPTTGYDSYAPKTLIFAQLASV